MPMRTLGPEGRWIVRSHISWRVRFKNLEGKSERESPKRTISVSGGIEMLQMVLEPDTRRCASEDAGPRRGVDCEIPHQLEREMKHSL